MTRILLTTFGSYGDIYPYLALSLELKNLGYEVSLATDNWYRSTVERQGINFLAVRPELAAIVQNEPQMMRRAMHATGGPEYIVRSLFLKHLKDSYEDIFEASENADLVITHPLTFAAVVAAEKRQIPWISCVLAPLSMFSIYDLPAMPTAPWMAEVTKLGPWATSFMRNQMKRATIGWFKPLVELRREVGLSPKLAHPLFEGQCSPALHLAMFSSILGPRQADWPDNTVVTGFPFYDRSDCSPEQLDSFQQFLTEGPPPIVFTLGSSAVWDAGDFFECSVAAARKLGRRAVLLVGTERAAEFQARYKRPEVGVFDYLPHQLVFEQAVAIVHQAGIGTTAQALRSGVPELIVPFSHDQPDNARRVAKIGAGRVLSRRGLNAAGMERELSLLLSDPTYAENASRIGDVVRTENGAKTGAEAIARYLDK